MTKQEFILELQDRLETEVILDENTNIKKLPEWDSLAAMVLIGFVAESCSVDLNAKDLENIDTVAALINKIGEGKFAQN